MTTILTGAAVGGAIWALKRAALAKNQSKPLFKIPFSTVENTDKIHSTKGYAYGCINHNSVNMVLTPLISAMIPSPIGLGVAAMVSGAIMTDDYLRSRTKQDGTGPNGKGIVETICNMVKSKTSNVLSPEAKGIKDGLRKILASSPKQDSNTISTIIKRNQDDTFTKSTQSAIKSILIDGDTSTDNDTEEDILRYRILEFFSSSNSTPIMKRELSKVLMSLNKKELTHLLNHHDTSLAGLLKNICLNQEEKCIIENSEDNKDIINLMGKVGKTLDALNRDAAPEVRKVMKKITDSKKVIDSKNKMD